MTKAVALFSGGLDSQLAVRLIQEQNIEVIGIYFSSPFFNKPSRVDEAAENLGIQLHTIHFSNEYLGILKNPRYGFGKNLNPCIDCHGLMLKLAGKYMEKIGADFIITGEVLKQRPKSQRLDGIRAVEKLSGYPGLILRPLSAKLLPPTYPEIKGLVNRDLLLDISGRSRKPQMQLAEKYGLQDYPAPGGGCMLTIPSFVERLRHFMEYHPEAELKEFEILKTGRHFFGPDSFHLIVGRKEIENQILEQKAKPDDLLFKVTNHPGPLSLLVNPNYLKCLDLQEEPIRLAAGITARYSDAKTLPLVQVKYWKPEQEPYYIEVSPIDPVQIESLIQK